MLILLSSPTLLRVLLLGRYIDLALAYSLGACLTPNVTCRFSREGRALVHVVISLSTVLMLLLHLMPVMSLIGGSLLTFLLWLNFAIVPGRLTLLARLHASLFGLLVGLTLLLGPPCRLLVLSRMFGIFFGMSLGWFQRRLVWPLGMQLLGLRRMIFGLVGIEMLSCVYFGAYSESGGPVVAPFLEEVCYGFAAGVWEVELLVAGGLVGCIGPVMVMRLMCIVRSILLVLPLLLFHSFVGVLNLWRMYSRVSRVRVLLIPGRMLHWGYWRAVCRHGPCGPLSSLHPWDNWVPPDLHGFKRGIFDSLEVLNGFLKQVVVSRRDIGIRKWTMWLREDLSSWPYAWFLPDFVPPSPFLIIKDPQTQCSRILVDPHLIDAEFRKAWMPFFCRSGHPVVTPGQFLDFVGHLLPREPYLDLPWITGWDLQEVARVKKSTAGGLDGWAWNEIEALPLPWFSGLAILLNLVEDTGTWPQRAPGCVQAVGFPSAWTSAGVG